MMQQTAQRLRIGGNYNRLRQARGSRGRGGAPDASVDAALAHARLYTGRSLARARLAQRLFSRICYRRRAEGFHGRWRGRPAHASSHELAVASVSANAVDRWVPPVTAQGGAGMWRRAAALFARTTTVRLAGRWI